MGHSAQLAVSTMAGVVPPNGKLVQHMYIVGVVFLAINLQLIMQDHPYLIFMPHQMYFSIIILCCIASNGYMSSNLC